ncbi:MAG: hypothetical protein ACTSX8_08975 [Alphaproteobacteria bacterium]
MASGLQMLAEMRRQALERGERRKQRALEQQLQTERLAHQSAEAEKERRWQERMKKWAAMTEIEAQKELARLKYELERALREEDWERAQELYDEYKTGESVWGGLFKGLLETGAGAFAGGAGFYGAKKLIED